MSFPLVFPGIRISAASVALLVAVAACGDAGAGPRAGARVGLAFIASTPNSASLNATVNDNDANTSLGSVPATVTVTPDGLRIVRDGDTLLVTRVQLVVRDVRLKRSLDVCPDDDQASTFVSTSVSTGDKTKAEKEKAAEMERECPSFEVGPFLVDIPVKGENAQRLSVMLPAGQYSRVSLRLKAVNDFGLDEQAFRVAHPDLRGASVRVEGRQRGQPFVFTADVNARLDVPLAAPLVVAKDGDDLAVTLDLGQWFARAGVGLYSPASANQNGNERAQVMNNIRAAFRAFRDHNRDGRED